MLMDVGMDTGPMLEIATTPIGLLDNTQDLAERLAAIGGDLLVETLLKLERQEIQPIPQDNLSATYAPLIQKEDYGLDWSKSAMQLHNQIRGFYPNCTATFRNNLLKIIASVPLASVGDVWRQAAPRLRNFPPELQELIDKLPDLSNVSNKPGVVVNITKGIGAIVQTGEGLLLLREVQLAGKRPQSGWDFVNGTRLTVGEVFSAGS
jgi:methionyl-tRNA formyltransferase